MYGLEPSPAEPIEHGPLVAAIAAFLRPAVYVELGVAAGDTFKLVASHCGEAWGVDLSPDSAAPVTSAGGHFYLGKAREFLLSREDASIDFAFLDSSHDFADTIDECIFLNAKVRKNGVILLHDAYPPNVEQQERGRCGDVWKAIPIIKANLEWEVTTLPAQYGLAICRKNCGRQLLWK